MGNALTKAGVTVVGAAVAIGIGTNLGSKLVEIFSNLALHGALGGH